MSFEEIMSCKSCSKESYLKVPCDRVLEKLDEHFARNDIAGAGRLLLYWENEARILGDDRGLLEILNELIGYYRRTNEKDKALASVKEAFALIEKLGDGNSVCFGTIYLNGATTMKAFDLAEEAIPYYEKARKIFEDKLDENDYRLAAFYNNVSSAYKDLGRLSDSENACLKAIEILGGDGKYNGEVAVTYINLAHLYHEADPFDERVEASLDKAYEMLTSKATVKDGAFAFLCSKCYPSFGYFGHFEREKEIRELTEKIYAGN